jgi:uncharacterized protein YyaL (SSP411 family)
MASGRIISSRPGRPGCPPTASSWDQSCSTKWGKLFVWTPDEIRSVLSDDADRFIEAYGVTARGNASTGSAHGFEGENTLELVGSLEEHEALAEARRRLFEARESRVHPGRDYKVLAWWNGLMLATFAEAARVLEREDCREGARAFTHPQAHARQVYKIRTYVITRSP